MQKCQTDDSWIKICSHTSLIVSSAARISSTSTVPTLTTRGIRGERSNQEENHALLSSCVPPFLDRTAAMSQLHGQTCEEAKVENNFSKNEHIHTGLGESTSTSIRLSFTSHSELDSFNIYLFLFSFFLFNLIVIKFFPCFFTLY